MQPTYVQEALPEFLTRENPQARLDEHGPQHLRSAELLSLLLTIPTDQAKKLLENQSVDLLFLPLQELKDHVTPRQAARIVAAIELSRRALSKHYGAKPSIASPVDTLAHLSQIRDQKKEHFQVLCLNARNQVIHHETISIGTLSASIVHPREVFQLAIEHTAASVIIAHNHPSGDTTPSREDLDVTQRLQKAGEIIGIDILDHIIISHDNYISLKEQGLM
ncbi:MAG: DNA repair protein RadC [Gemmatimonadetes bacterium]|jgi:DNA repair protein RadC|nr:DNA repair protein RadC [Gemmatimonadota bacterium]MBT5141084.1 DNA repair protein RadC [Gemmatimonadota bacterium]MBT5592071.1 DNA repair protein RadC [Gemmatimonadota bacterium]MBT5964653.1 DNA repair protein RadC [Gemmatimonadota bacterium]MBT6628364.1 DNA repair protein RadC [Gemmatimonadota bacterium]